MSISYVEQGVANCFPLSEKEKSELEEKVSSSFKRLTDNTKNSLKTLGFTRVYSISSLPIHPEVKSQEESHFMENSVDTSVQRGIAICGSAYTCWISVAVECEVKKETFDQENNRVKGYIKIFEKYPGSDWEIDDSFPNEALVVPMFWKESMNDRKASLSARKHFHQLLTKGKVKDQKNRQWKMIGHPSTFAPPKRAFKPFSCVIS